MARGLSESFGAWEKDIRSYCASNGLDFEKAKAMKKCWGIDFLKLKPADNEKCVTLLVCRNVDGSARCEQTEHTRRYLAQ